MSALLWWKGRLHERKALWRPGSMINGVTVRVAEKTKVNQREDPNWPDSVARTALYADYLDWHENEYVATVRRIAGDAVAEYVPPAADEAGFYATLSPLLYVYGRSAQVRVRSILRGDGTRTTKYFVRLPPVDVCQLALEVWLGEPNAMFGDKYAYARIGALGRIRTNDVADVRLRARLMKNQMNKRSRSDDASST